MSTTTSPAVEELANQHFQENLKAWRAVVDGKFLSLLTLEWLAVIIAAFYISPRSWVGEHPQIHLYVWAAVCLGGLVTLPTLYMCLYQPGAGWTRQMVAINQMLLGCLLIHICRGRIETHFHIFGSLAFLAFYRDIRVIMTASLYVALDHFFRGMGWPQSVFGSSDFSQWRWMEHMSWVVFIDLFLVRACQRSLLEMKTIAIRQAELELTNDRIEQEVNNRTAELKETTEELKISELKSQAANRAKGEFLANMSHEIRTPMNAILGMTELVLETELTGNQREYLSTVHTSTLNLLEIINEILDYSKIEAGKMEIDSEPIQPGQIIDETVRVLGFTAREKGLRLTYHVDPVVPRVVLGDPLRIRQVLTNLVGNAIKFTNNGEVKVLLTQNPGSMEGNTFLLHFQVQDTGIGISEEKQKIIFEPFSQADSTTKRRFGGSGLGLSICSQLTRLMGGTIWVESKTFLGSTFHFTVRVGLSQVLEQNSEERSESGTLRPFSVDSAIPSRKLRILLAEDTLINQRVMTHALAQDNHTVVIAQNGHEAVEAVKKQDFDVVLMDLQMPVMDGCEATVAIRQYEQRRIEEKRRNSPHDPLPGRLLIIALTAMAMRDDTEKCLQAGMDGYLSKPFRLAELRKILEKHTRGKTQDLVVLDQGSALKSLGDDENLFLELAEIFMKTAPGLLQQMDQGFGSKNLGQVRLATHTLQGSAVHFSATATISACQQLQQAINQEDWNSVRDMVLQVKHHCQRLMESLADLLNHRQVEVNP